MFTMAVTQTAKPDGELAYKTIHRSSDAALFEGLEQQFPYLCFEEQQELIVVVAEEEVSARNGLAALQFRNKMRVADLNGEAADWARISLIMLRDWLWFSAQGKKSKTLMAMSTIPVVNVQFEMPIQIPQNEMIAVVGAVTWGTIPTEDRVNRNNPKFDIRLPVNQKTIRRIAAHTYEGVKWPEYFGDYILEEDELAVDVLALSDKNGDRYYTFNSRKYQRTPVDLESKEPQQLLRPDPGSLSGVQEDLFYVDKVLPSIASRLIRASLENGVELEAFQHHSMTIDVTCSLITATTFGNVFLTAQDIGNVNPMALLAATNGGSVDPEALDKASLYDSIEITSRSGAHEKGLQKQFDRCAEDIQEAIFRFLADTGEKGRNIASTVFAPVGGIVRITVSKSIADWRRWLKTESVYLEQLYLKAGLSKHLLKDLEFMFFDCAGSIEEYERRLKLYETQRKDAEENG